MAAKIVVIVQDQNLSRGIGASAIEVRRCKAADAATHYNKIVRFSRVGWRHGTLEDFAVAQRVRVVIGPLMTAAHSSQFGRIVSRPVLGECGLGACFFAKRARAAIATRT